MVWSCTHRLQRPGHRARGMTIEYQRSQAKAMQQYFRELNAQKAAEKAQCVARIPGAARVEYPSPHPWFSVS